jgi:uncharacterized protein YndB with AHSA1/START domain
LAQRCRAGQTGAADGTALTDMETALARATRPVTSGAVMTATHSASRMILATPRAIFRAFVDPEVLPNWRAPTGMDARLLAFDPRVGGGYRMELTYHDPATSDPKSTERSDIVEASFVELLPDEKIVETVRFESDDPRFAGTMTVTTMLKPVTGGTKVTSLAENVPPGIRETDHVAGMESTLKNLANLLE